MAPTVPAIETVRYRTTRVRDVIDRDEQPIAWREAGPADGDVVVFLHGLGATRTSWDLQLAELADRWRCVAWDMPGYGASPSPGGPLTFEFIADAAAGLLDTLGSATAHLVGLSFGGMHALHTALRHPDRVRSLSLVDSSPAFGLDGETTREGWIAARLEAIDGGASVRDISPLVLAAISGPGFGGADLDHAIASMNRISEDGLRAAVHLLPDHDVLDRLSTIDVPTLVVVGELDEETPPAYAAALATGIPGTRRHEVIPGVGHLTPLEAPATFNPILRSFLETVHTMETL